LREYLFLLVDQATREQGIRLDPTNWELQAVRRIRDRILSEILQHHSITELAKKEKINPFRLKIFFKREFNVGPYEFLLSARLEKARELMEQGMPMKQAAPLAGYRITSFITAFKRKYGYSPELTQRKK
jgi:AraC family transcriptional regulator, transcriptional activator of the genes for pyochelin and ferripyochelin receptors